ncbi:MAG: ATP-binding cassette domain-containing protein [Pseudomonadota bacterium]
MDRPLQYLCLFLVVLEDDGSPVVDTVNNSGDRSGGSTGVSAAIDSGKTTETGAGRTEIAVRASGITHRYGKKVALDSVEFELYRGEFLALLGPNGSGKTTLFSLLTRLLVADSGHIDLFGHRIERAPANTLCRLGVVFQQPTLDLDLTVEQNLSYHGALQGLSKKEVRSRAGLELERLALGDRAHDRVRSLNGGHRRRVEVARALLHRPDLLLLDEASAGLDFGTRTSLYEHVRALCDERNLAVLWTTHLVEELGPHDQTLVLRDGKIQARGTFASLAEEHGSGNINHALAALTSGDTPP